jgi:hypothetical protein
LTTCPLIDWAFSIKKKKKGIEKGQETGNITTKRGKKKVLSIPPLLLSPEAAEASVKRKLLNRPPQ